MLPLTFIVLLFITGGGDSAVHEQVAAPPSGSGKPSFKGGFSLPIIHRNDPRSPIRDPTVTTLDLFKEEIQLALSPMPADDALASEKCLPQSVSAVVSTLCRSASVVLSTASL